MPSKKLAIVFAFALVLTASTLCSAQMGQYSLSGGYSHLYTPNHPGLFFDRDGGYLDADFAWRIPYSGSPLLLGFGITGSGYYDTQDVTFPLNNNFIADTTLYSDVGDVELEPRIGVELRIPRTHLFLKPSIGAGLLINDYSIDQLITQNNITYIHTLDHTGAAFEVHPALQAGVAWGRAAAGVELSYLAAWGDFGNFGNRQQQLRAGAFFTFKF